MCKQCCQTAIINKPNVWIHLSWLTLAFLGLQKLFFVCCDQQSTVCRHPCTASPTQMGGESDPQCCRTKQCHWQQNTPNTSVYIRTYIHMYVHTYICTYIRTYVRTCVFYHSLIYSSYIALTSVCLVLPCTTSLSSTTYTYTYICSYVPYSVYVCT